MPQSKKTARIKKKHKYSESNSLYLSQFAVLAEPRIDLEKKHSPPEILFFRFTLFEASPLPRSRSCVAPFQLYWDEKKMCTRNARRVFSFFIKFFWDQVYMNFIQFKVSLEGRRSFVSTIYHLRIQDCIWIILLHDIQSFYINYERFYYEKWNNDFFNIMQYLLIFRKIIYLFPFNFNYILTSRNALWIMQFLTIFSNHIF